MKCYKLLINYRMLKQRLIQYLGISICIVLSACSAPDLIPEKPDSHSLEQERNKQFLLAHQYQLKQKIRLLEVARPLLTSNTQYCPKQQKHSLGILLHRLDDYPKEQQQAIESLYLLDERLQIQHILNSSPAQSHLEPGDILLNINGTPITPVKGLAQLQESLTDGQPVTLKLLRQGNEKSVTITPEMICNYPVLLSSSDAINGYADGTTIIITAGLMRFATQDNELALIIAHEMAHNTLAHISQRFGNSAVGSLIDLVLISSGIPSPLIATGIGAHRYSRDFEMEADLIGLRLMHNAGFDITGMDDFWRRMASLHPRSITHGKQISHPTTVERAIQLEKAIKEIKSSKSLSTDSTTAR